VHEQSRYGVASGRKQQHPGRCKRTTELEAEHGDNANETDQ
jgi:hypothetical protein